MTKRFPAWSLVLAASISVQFGAGIGASLFDDLGPAGASLLRIGLATPILLVVWRPDPRRHSRGDLALAALFGLVLGLMNLTFYLGLDRIPLGIAVTIEFIGPLAVAVVGSRRRADLLFAALAALGIVLLSSGDAGGDGPLDPVGVAFVLFAGACWAAYILIAQRLGQRFTGGRGLALASVVAAFVPLGPGIAQGGGDLVQPHLLALGAAVALMSSVIPYTLEAEALRRIRPSVFGVLMSLDPALAALAGFLILGQALGSRDVFAIALVVVASIAVTRGAEEVPPPIDG